MMICRQLHGWGLATLLMALFIPASSRTSEMPPLVQDDIVCLTYQSEVTVSDGGPSAVGMDFSLFVNGTIRANEGKHLFVVREPSFVRHVFAAFPKGKGARVAADAEARFWKVFGNERPTIRKQMFLKAALIQNPVFPIYAKLIYRRPILGMRIFKRSLAIPLGELELSDFVDPDTGSGYVTALDQGLPSAIAFFQDRSPAKAEALEQIRNDVEAFELHIAAPANARLWEGYIKVTELKWKDPRLRMKLLWSSEGDTLP